MKLLVDMNLSPDWIPMLQACGWEARHWSEIGPGNAADIELLKWSREYGHVVLTPDLDFSQLLFSTGSIGPSVVLLRMKDEFDAAARANVINALHVAASDLGNGALLIISGYRARLRRLPLTL